MMRVIVTAAFLLAVANAFGTDLWVPSQYPTIQSAVDAASDGDTIIVLPGVYSENIQWDVNDLTLTSVNPEDPCVVAATIIESGSYITLTLDSAIIGGLLTGVTISSNGAGVDGNNVATAIISNCVIRDNSTGVYRWAGTISHCIIRNNSTGVNVVGGLISDCLIYDNQDKGIIQSSGSIINCTITNNNYGVSNVTSSLNVINCIIWGNQQQIPISNPPARITHSCVQDGAFGEDIIEDDPLFIDPVNEDFRLQADSPCIDSGKNTGPSFMQLYDLNGNFRQIDGDGDGNAVIDMGTYEYGSATEPIISVWPEEILFISLNGSVPEPNHFYISNIGPGLLNWAITEDCPWLSVTPLSGYSTEVTVMADISGLGSGLNTYNLVVRDSTGNSQAVIRVDCVILDTNNLNVPAQYPTIQSAIDAANDGDTVVVAPGPDIYTGGTISSKAITVRSIDPNDKWIVNNTVISGFTFQSYGPNSVVEGFTISGGGIKINTYTSPVIRNCIITNNTATSMGGGIYCFGTNSSPSIINCDITNNYAFANGGGMCIGSSGSPAIIDCRITGNYAGSTSGKGGGIYCSQGKPTIRNCVISDNFATNGGGIWMHPSVVGVIEDCKILNNKSTNNGAGLCIESSGSGGSTNISRSEISGNVAAAEGGGIWTNANTPFEISDSIISANFAQNEGGGFYGGQNIRVNRCTISGNSGRGMYVIRAVLSNCILWGNSRPGGPITDAQILPPWNPEYKYVEIRYSCIQDDDANDANIPFGGADNGNIDDNPMFVREPNDGGDGWGVGNNDDYGDLHLRPESPCIEAGDPFYAGWTKVKDIDGELRVMGYAFDMGADEYGKMIVVARPVADEVWATGSKHPIKWDKYGVGSVNILFSTDAGVSWETLAEGITDANSYLWQLPDDVDSNQCVISVVPADGDVNVIALESGLFTISWYPTRPAVPSQWLRRGLLPSPDLNENKGPRIGCVKWVFETDGPVSSQVAVTRAYWDSYWIYIGSEDGNIYSLDDLGELNWIYDINTPIVGSPAVGYYWMVYVAGQNGWLYAIDDYGYLCWTHKTDAPIYSTPVVGYDGKIYVCSEDGSLYALDVDGSELWTFATQGPANLNGAIFATPVIDKNNTVYIGGLYEPNLYALDANSGSVKWVCDFGAAKQNKGQIVTSPAIGPDGTIYQTLVRDPNLYAIDPCTGNMLWSTPMRPDPCYSCAPGSGSCCTTIDLYLTKLRSHAAISPTLLQQYQSCNEGRWQGITAVGWMNYTTSSGWSSPVVGSDGTIYVSFDDPYLRAVEPNGAIKWITRLGVIGGFTLSIDRDNFIYAASDDNYVCVVDSTGLEVSRFKGNNWMSFPAIAEDGTLIVSDANNRVWAITSYSCDGQSPVLRKPADIRESGKVDFLDYALFAESWRYCTDPFDAAYCASGIAKYGFYAPGDVDRDASVSVWDLNELAEAWLIQSEFE
jgi:outer membrane protein assembly factor BamB